MLKMLVIACFSVWPGYQAKQLYSYSSTGGFFSQPLWILIVAGPLEVESTLQLTLCWGDQSEGNMQPIWQRGLTHGGGAPAFVACDALNRLPRILGVAGVEISLQCLLCLLAHRVQKLDPGCCDEAQSLWRCGRKNLLYPIAKHTWDLFHFIFLDVSWQEVG